MSEPELPPEHPDAPVEDAGGVAPAEADPGTAAAQAPAPAPPSKSPAKRASDFFVALDKAIRADRMYRGQGEIVSRLNQELVNRARVVALDEPITLKVASVGVMYEGTPVTSTEERTEYLFRLYCDGVRELTLQPGIPDEEALALVEVFKTDLKEDDEDLVTLLWRQNLEHIRYYAVDSFAGGANIDEGALAAQRAKARLDRDGEGAVELSLTSADLRILRTDDLVDWVREADAPTAPQEAERERVEQLRDRWTSDGDLRRFLSVTLQVLAQQGEAAVGAEAMALGAYDGLMSEGDTAGLVTCLQSVAPSRGALPPPVVALRDSMLGSKRVPRLAALLDRDPDVLLDPLMAFEPVARDTLVALLTAIPRGPAEEKLQQALGAAGVDLTPYYARRLQSEDTEEVLGALAALGRIGSPEALGAVGDALSSTLTRVRRAALEALQGTYDPARRVQLSRCLKDPDAENRSLALRIIADSGDPRLCWAVVSLVEDPASGRMAPDELQALYQALGNFRDDRTLGHFKKVLTEKNLTRSKAITSRQHLVAEALGLMQTEQAREVASTFSGKWHLPREVRDALDRASRGIT